MLTARAENFLRGSPDPDDTIARLAGLRAGRSGCSLRALHGPPGGPECPARRGGPPRQRADARLDPHGRRAGRARREPRSRSAGRSPSPPTLRRCEPAGSCSSGGPTTTRPTRPRACGSSARRSAERADALALRVEQRLTGDLARYPAAEDVHTRPASRARPRPADRRRRSSARRCSRSRRSSPGRRSRPRPAPARCRARPSADRRAPGSAAAPRPARASPRPAPRRR